MRISDNVEVLDIKGCSPVMVWDGSDLVLIDAGYPMQFGFMKPAIERPDFLLTELQK